MPAWQRHTAWRRGCIGVSQHFDATLMRHVTVARLAAHGGSGEDLYPPLHDVMLVSAVPDRWTITGYERLRAELLDREVSYQQSWVLMPASVRDEADAWARKYAAEIASGVRK